MGDEAGVVLPWGAQKQRTQEGGKAVVGHLVVVLVLQHFLYQREYSFQQALVGVGQL